MNARARTFLCIMLLTSLPCSYGLQKVKTGADVFIEKRMDLLQGKRVGLITNPTGRLSSGKFLLDTLQALHVQVAALFGPEHGVRGKAAAGEVVPDAREDGIPVYSLYGKIRKPTPQMLSNVDILVYDIQDVGVRFYTYTSTMGLAMEAAAEMNIPFVVLDRPNPLGGMKCDGPVMEDSLKSFVGQYPLPVVYGLTCGELARMINGEYWLANRVRAQLIVVEMEGWTRMMLWEDTGLPWVAPSPNIPDPPTALTYPSTCFIEATNISEGRGTDRPFQYVGAPFLNSEELTSELQHLNLGGVRWTPAAFTPRSSKHTGEYCNGVRLSVDDFEALQPTVTGLELLATLVRVGGKEVKIKGKSLQRLVGSGEICRKIMSSIPFSESDWGREVSEFKRASQQYYLYP